MDVVALLVSPAAWAAFATLVVMEVVLGIDNLLFVSLLTNRLPPEQRARLRRIGIGLALVLRLVLLAGIAWLAGLTRPVIDLGLHGPPGAHGEPTFETALSWRDVILVAGGLFLVWKATGEIGGAVRGESGHVGGGGGAPDAGATARALSPGTAIAQILALDLVFSLDSILTAVGMTDQLPIMMAAVIVAVALMLVAAGPLAAFLERHPAVVMLALAFLLMVGLVLIADGFGVHVPKGYIYAAMAFSALVEALNLAARRHRGSGRH